MKKQLEMDGETAKKLYPSAQPEFKTMLEESFGKDFFTQKITDRVKNYDDILEISGVRKLADKVEVEGFNDAENKVVQAFIKKMRIAKVYNEGWFPKRGEYRYYPWYNVSSGFSFNSSNYVSDHAFAPSASRLCLKSKELVNDMVSKFKDVDEALIEIMD